VSSRAPWPRRRPQGSRLSPPAAPGAFADPSVLPVPGGYVAFATGGPDRQVKVRTSPDLARWEEGGDGLAALPGWARPGRTWSPAALRRGGGYVLWYATWHRASGRQALSVAVADRPTGPYLDASSGPAVLQEDQGGSIDPSPFVDADGQAYLVWKADANAVGRRAGLYGAPLDGAGTGLAGPPVHLLAHDRRWERPLIEAPCLLRTGPGRYLLLYSGGRWHTAGYAVGYAVASHPLGPWRKVTRRAPWLHSDPVGSGPGGQEAFTAHDGRRLLAYHAWEPGRVGGSGVRSLRLGELDLTGPEPRLAPLPPAG